MYDKNNPTTINSTIKLELLIDSIMATTIGEYTNILLIQESILFAKNIFTFTS